MEGLIGKLDEAESLLDSIEGQMAELRLERNGAWKRNEELEGEVAEWSHRALDAEKLNTDLEKELALATIEIERLKNA